MSKLRLAKHIIVYGTLRWTDPETGIQARINAEKIFINAGRDGQVTLDTPLFEQMLIGLGVIFDVKVLNRKMKEKKNKDDRAIDACIENLKKVQMQSITNYRQTVPRRIYK